MSIVKVREYLKDFGADGRILEFPVSSATVELAAKALGTAPARIAKTLSFRLKDGVILVVLAGDAKTDNRKYRETFGEKARMLDREEAETLVGYVVGGVCLFDVNEGVKVYLDVSLKRFATVFPAAGSANSAIELTPAELEKFSRASGWVDVGKLPDDAE